GGVRTAGGRRPRSRGCRRTFSSGGPRPRAKAIAAARPPPLTLCVTTHILLPMISRLQDEIKQRRPFASLEQEAFLSLGRTWALLDHVLAEALKPHGITPTQYNVLRILRGAGQEGL